MKGNPKREIYKKRKNSSVMSRVDLSSNVATVKNIKTRMRKLQCKTTTTLTTLNWKLKSMSKILWLDAPLVKLKSKIVANLRRKRFKASNSM